MTSPRDLIGLSGPPFQVPIERGKVREFAAGTYSRHPAYRNDPRPPIPPTFLAMAGYVWGYTLERPRGTALEAANLHLAMTLHGEDEFVFHGPPPRAGDVLTAVTRVEDVIEKTGRRAGRIVLYVMLTEFRDPAGRLVAIDRTTSVETERAPSGEAEGVTPPERRPFFVRDEGADLIAAIRPARAADLRVGAGPGPVTFPPLTPTEIVRYQGAASDDHPMHHDDNHARAGGYPCAFSVGLLHVGALASYATQWLAPANVRRLKARFLALQWPGDRLTYEGRIARLYEEAGERRVDLDLTCARQTGERTLDVAMTFVAPA
jgi:acyl dehydratase